MESARLLPKMEMIDPGATARPAVKAAASTMPPEAMAGVIRAVPVKSTAIPETVALNCWIPAVGPRITVAKAIPF